MLKKSLCAATNGKACEKNIYVDGKVRFTVLFGRLLRCEYSPCGVFEDGATQSIWFRNMPEVSFSVRKNKHGYSVETDSVIFIYSVRSRTVTEVIFKDRYNRVQVSDRNNLGGTVRTLDMNAGVVKLGNGLVSSDGVTVYDDSDSFTVKENGEISKREHKEKDIYVFAYGHAYRECIADFYRISGSVPMIPRFALGNWWSRYHKYTQNEYESLMQRFIDEDIPITVATVDMDWHWVDIADKLPKGEKRLFHNPFQADGWTGYSWNTDFFPDYKGFFSFLKEKNLHITLNLHPRDGVRAHEDMYEEMAKANGIDPSTKQGVPFRLGDPDFWNSYFDVIHKPYEKDGVDFWWIDWQQGTALDVKGLDPLWMLNHYHFLDNGEDGRIPLILSRYAGIGSHRYPLGFSGDTVICWNSLKIQPCFTAIAANVGYSWWSHDIGGHNVGYRDDELYLRWVQLGVFSPVMRLHSSHDDLLGKEPWRYKSEVDEVCRRFLRLRHALIPYIYTMDRLTHTDGRALCEPMYYSYPDCREAYRVPNEYFFGTQLIAAPITSHTDPGINTASTKVWLPSGRWTDVFTGRVYHGNKTVEMHRDLASFPLLAKEGAIIPMSADKGNSTDNPKNLKVFIYRGIGDFSLYEDNGRTDCDSHNAETVFSVRSDTAKTVFTCTGAKGDVSVLPGRRSYTFCFRDIIKVRSYTVKINGETAGVYGCPADAQSMNTFEITVEDALCTDCIEIIIDRYEPLKNEDYRQRLINVFSRLQCRNLFKDTLYAGVKKAGTKEECLEAVRKLPVSCHVKSALLECFED